MKWEIVVMRLLVIAAVVFAATLQPANACRDPKWNTRTLLTSLPPGYDRHSVAAQVEIVAVNVPAHNIEAQWSPEATVRVVTAIKGTKIGDQFIVSTGGTSCDSFFDRKDDYSTLRPFIVGGFVEPTADRGVIFIGKWLTDLTTGTLRPAL
jgi:hypothetical protein